MKILRVINSLDIGGAERSIVGNIPYHIKNGFDMEVLLLNGFDTFFKKELENNDVKIHVLGKNNNIYNPVLVFKLCKFINKYDVIHVHLFPALYWVAFAKILMFSKTKLIFTEHNTNNKRRNIFLLKLIDNIIYKKYTKIIAISPETKKNLSNHINETDKIITIYNGVDIKKIKDQSKNSNNEIKSKLLGKKVILQIASFRQAKDQATVIKALSLLPNNFHVLFAGDGITMKKCVELAQSINVIDRITFLGVQDNIGSILGLADIVVMSSHWEGFGRAAIEGMAIGKPLIASNVPGLSALVEGAGLLFEVGDFKKLSELIIKLIDDKEFYEIVSARCEKRAEKYDISFMINQYENVYLNINK